MLIHVFYLFMCVGMLVGGSLHADSLNATEQENQKLKAEVQALREELDMVKSILVAKGIWPSSQDAEQKQKTSLVEKPAVTSKYNLQLYGRVRLSAGWDSSRVNNGNYARWVEPSSTAEAGDDELNITARHSRLGVKLSGPESERMKTSGRVEVDFYEGGAENQNTIRMRHAYVELEWPEEQFSILAGQTYDLMFEPVFPETVSHNPLWWVGKYGSRRPQLRLTKETALSDTMQWENSVALARTIGDTLGNDPGDTGEDSGIPTIQARSSLQFSLLGKPATVGVSGHYGKEEYDLAAGSDKGTDFKTESVKTHLEWQMLPYLTWKGEIWRGKNLDAYAAGIGQGVNSTRLKSIRSEGGWSTLTLHDLRGSLSKWRFNIGYGQDNPYDSDLNSGDRSNNTVVFGNGIYAINEAVSVGLEIAHWETDYLNQDDAEANRVEMYVNYSF